VAECVCAQARDEAATRVFLNKSMVYFRFRSRTWASCRSIRHHLLSSQKFHASTPAYLSEKIGLLALIAIVSRTCSTSREQDFPDLATLRETGAQDENRHG